MTPKFIRFHIREAKGCAFENYSKQTRLYQGRIDIVMKLTICAIALAIFLPSSIVGQGLSYNYYDELAHSYCASRNTKPGYVFAIRRDCGGNGPSCATICQHVKSEALEVINNQAQK